MSDLIHTVCPACLTVNRLSADRLTDQPRCGLCKKPLFAGKPTAVDQPAFDKHVQSGELPVVVDFWAPWCGPCRTMAPTYEAVAAKLEPQLRFLKVNTEAEPALGAAHHIRSIPTLVIFHRGHEIGRRVGALPATTLEAWIKQTLQNGAPTP